MLANVASSKGLPGEPNCRLPPHSAARLPAGNRLAGACTTAKDALVPGFGVGVLASGLLKRPLRWKQLAFAVMAAMIAILMIVWIVRTDAGHFAASSLPTEANAVQTPSGLRAQQTVDADLHFKEHAQATEDGFKAAFPFQK